MNHADSHGPEVIGELVGVPAEKRIAAIDVERTENSERARGGNFMLKGVACKQSMVGFDVELDFVLKVEPLEERVHGGYIEIVLVRSGFFRLGLDENLALKSDFVLVLDNQGKEAAHLLEFLLHIGIEERFVTFAATPENVIRPTEALCGVHAILDGGCA